MAMPSTSLPRLRIASSVVTKHAHPPSRAHDRCKASFAFSPTPTREFACCKMAGVSSMSTAAYCLHALIVVRLSSKGLASFSKSRIYDQTSSSLPSRTMFLNTQLGFRFEPNPRLLLIVKRTIEATVVEVDSHIWIHQILTTRVLSALIEAESNGTERQSLS